MTAYLTSMRLEGLSETYVTDAARALRRLARQLPVPLLEATPEMLWAWRSGLLLSASSVRNYVGHARRYYAWAARQGLVPASPADGLPVPRKRQLLPRPIPTAELEDVVAAAPRRIRAWIVLSAWCGLRAKEIALLRGENVHLDAPVPYLLVAADATKGSRERVVALCEFAAAELADARLPRRGWAFTRRDGQPGPNTPARVSALINRHYRDCGTTATCHAGRHWFGTTFYEESGRDLLATALAMGHASVASTQGYAKVSPTTAAAVVARFPVPRQLRHLRAAV